MNETLMSKDKLLELGNKVGQNRIYKKYIAFSLNNKFLF